MFFYAAAVYGFLLSAMIFSALLTPTFVGLFVAEPYSLGSHGADWAYWHGASCAFVGLVCALATAWPEPARRSMAAAAGLIFGTWGVQNLWMVLTTDRYQPLMWLHVVLCLAVGVWGIATALRMRAAAPAVQHNSPT